VAQHGSRSEEKQNLWGGRFKQKQNKEFAEFNNSFSFDKRLFFADIFASIGHAEGLSRAGVLSKRELSRIKNGLQTLEKQARFDDSFLENASDEDVHSFIEDRLVKLIGDTGKKLHTGRSRNDQVSTAFRLWLRERVDVIDASIKDTQRALIDAAERHVDAVIPGYTHLQRAQPILWAHWCLAYFEMLVRDRERLADARKRINILPLGSGALAGSGFNVDREAVAKALGFEGVTRNSLDGVSDRDFAVEFTGCCSLIMVHLSRLAEDLILYCSTEFGFVELSDTVSSGSSLMPQKKNPDALELLRGKAGRIFGHQMSLLAMLKGLPLAYNKDMQEDKEAVFDTVDTVSVSLKAAAMVFDNLTVREWRAHDAASKGYLNATELADYLVKKGVPFREAHETVGKAVLFAIETDKELHELDIVDLRRFSKKIESDVFEALDLNSALAAKNVVGGTAPARVKAELKRANRFVKRHVR
jgi:argininosuccinate lyase